MKDLNHTCIICGKKYHSCDSCNNVKKIKPWRSITDTSNHYQIYLIINDYNYSNIDKKTARDMLLKCDLSELENFIPNVAKIIKDILSCDKNKTRKQKEKLNNTLDDQVTQDNI